MLALASRGASAQGPPQAPTPTTQTTDVSLSDAEPLRIRVYADAQGRTREGDAAATFSMGGVDLFLTSRPSPRVNLLAEVLFEPGEDNVFVVDVERLAGEYRIHEALVLGLGRYHTSIGFYNTAFHHGTYFQTATGRPSIFAFEDDGGLLPLHGVGAWARGAASLPGLELRYRLEISNGRPGRAGPEPVQNVQDEDQHKAVNLAVAALLQGVPGLQLGVSYYRDRPRLEAAVRLGESILAGHVAYQTLEAELLVETLLLRHEPASGGASFSSWAGYAQASRAFGRFRPFARYERVDLAAGDPAYAGSEEVRGPSLGLRFDLADSMALKFQADRRAGSGFEDRTSATLQVAVAF